MLALEAGLPHCSILTLLLAEQLFPTLPQAELKSPLFDRSCSGQVIAAVQAEAHPRVVTDR